MGIDIKDDFLIHNTNIKEIFIIISLTEKVKSRTLFIMSHTMANSKTVSSTDKVKSPLETNINIKVNSNKVNIMVRV